ncbi:MAG: N-6 DNA methylase, partial [Flavobacteriales bacterium]|nr:N-6 DNA methylase [Flavobacteriales bacterium]
RLLNKSNSLVISNDKFAVDSVLIICFLVMRLFYVTSKATPKVFSATCQYIITSNFEKLRFYIQTSNEVEEFNLFNLTEERFELLYLCLAQDNLLSNVPLKIKEASVQEEETITKKFYADYSLFKRELFRDLVKQNMGNEVFRTELDKEDTERATKNIKQALFKKSQKLIDRFLFIFFAEDRGLLPPNSTLKILEQWNKLKELDEIVPLFSRYQKYFSYLDTGRKGTDKTAEIFAYNGGLFKPDAILDSLIISDELLHNHTKDLQAYDFESQVDVNILGHIFENSLNEIESVNAEIEGGEFVEQTSKRKKDGVFYTPKYITKYIVDNTVGKLSVEKKSELGIEEAEYLKNRKGRPAQTLKALQTKLETYRDWLLTLTICDPACGSGAFLNQALDFLIKEHQYIDELQTNLLGGGFVFPDIENTVLENNIFGVDINEESVEIAKLSLWLRTAQPRRKLNDLSSNIKCGNSLIDDKSVAGNKAFKWEDEYSEIFAQGGFDVVIGNPPYVDIKGLDNEIVKYLFDSFKSANNRVNLYSSFIERSVGLMNKKGCFSFIIPSSLLTQESYKDLRSLLLNNTTIENIVRLPNESFGGSAGDVKVDTIILTSKAGILDNAQADIIIYKGFDRINEISNYNSDIHFTINPFDWKNDNDFIFRINVDSSTIKIIDKCEVETKRLNDCAEFCLGLTPYDKYKGHSPEQIKSRAFHSDFQKDKSYKQLLAGNDIKRYNVEWGGEEWISYGDWLGAQREKRFFVDKRILVKQIIDWSDKRIWAALTNTELYNTQNAFNLLPVQENFEGEYLIAIVNSKLMSFYHRKKFLEEFKDRFQKILIKDAKEFPIKDITLNEQQKYTQKVSSIVEQTAVLREKMEKFSKYYSGQFALDKLSRKLQNWHELDFADFIQELNKAIKKADGEKLSKSDEMDWMDVFETKKTEAQTLKAEIDKTDNEIDQMVYELYGLSEEEIKIVEGE